MTDPAGEGRVLSCGHRDDEWIALEARLRAVEGERDVYIADLKRSLSTQSALAIEAQAEARRLKEVALVETRELWGLALEILALEIIDDLDRSLISFRDVHRPIEKIDTVLTPQEPTR